MRIPSHLLRNLDQVIIQFFSPLSSTPLHPDLLPQYLIYSSFTFILKKIHTCPYGLHCLLVHGLAFTSEVVLCKVLNEFLILASEGHVLVVTPLTLQQSATWLAANSFLQLLKNYPHHHHHCPTSLVISYSSFWIHVCLFKPDVAISLRSLPCFPQNQCEETQCGTPPPNSLIHSTLSHSFSVSDMIATVLA